MGWNLLIPGLDGLSFMFGGCIVYESMRMVNGMKLLNLHLLRFFSSTNNNRERAFHLVRHSFSTLHHGRLLPSPPIRPLLPLAPPSARFLPQALTNLTTSHEHILLFFPLPRILTSHAIQSGVH